MACRAASSRPTSSARCGWRGRIRTGTISVNGGMRIAGDLPFGGYKHSGIGRDWGVEGIEEYLETKTVAYRK